MANNAKNSMIMEYKDTIRQLNNTIEAQSQLIVSRKEALNASTTAPQNLQEQVAYLTRKLFGTSSEKCNDLTGQLSLFNEAEQEADASITEISDEETTVHEHIRKSKSRSEEIFKGVPVKEEVIELTEAEQSCIICNDLLERIGKEFVRQEFRFTPARGTLVKIYRATYKCPECSTSNSLATNIQFVKAHVPGVMIPHSYASASVVAWVMYQKYVN